MRSAALFRFSNSQVQFPLIDVSDGEFCTDDNMGKRGFFSTGDGRDKSGPYTTPDKSGK
jgi:hypothetical protein